MYVDGGLTWLKRNIKIVKSFYHMSLGLILVSSVYGADELQYSNDDIVMGTTIYDVSSDLSNDDIQSMLDNAGQEIPLILLARNIRGFH